MVRFSYTYNDVKAMQLNSNNHKHNFNLNGTFNVTNTIKLNYTATYQNQYIKNRPYRISRLTNNFGGMFGGFTDVALHTRSYGDKSRLPKQHLCL